MKTEYLIHEYMWSNHCISGNKLGWGITASSMPEDRAYLRELEKLAQAAVIDKTGKTEVDELVYSSVCGFVKMSSVPCESGEDKRQNKRVRIYQPKAPESNPVAYLAPGGEWAEEESVGYLQPLFLEEPEFHRKDILQEMNLMSRLPEFMQVVFWCLSGHSEGINIVAPDWKEEEFAEKALTDIYIIPMGTEIECLKIAQTLRKAGYKTEVEMKKSRICFLYKRGNPIRFFLFFTESMWNKVF